MKRRIIFPAGALAFSLSITGGSDDNNVFARMEEAAKTVSRDLSKNHKNPLYSNGQGFFS